MLVEATLNAESFYSRHGFIKVADGNFSHGGAATDLEIVKMVLA